MLTEKQAAADLMQVRQLISNLIATTQDTEARQELTRTLSAMTDPLMAIYDPQTPSTMQDWGTLNDQLNALDSMDTEQTLGFISTLSHSLMHLMNNTGLQNYKAHECTTGAAILIYDIKEKLEAKVANSQFTASDIERLMQLENVQKCGWDSDTLKGKIADIVREIPTKNPSNIAGELDYRALLERRANFVAEHALMPEQDGMEEYLRQTIEVIWERTASAINNGTVDDQIAFVSSFDEDVHRKFSERLTTFLDGRPLTQDLNTEFRDIYYDVIIDELDEAVIDGCSKMAALNASKSDTEILEIIFDEFGDTGGHKVLTEEFETYRANMSSTGLSR